MIANHYYILDENGDPVEAKDIHEWDRWREDRSKGRIGEDVIDGTRVSTVFLGINHSFRGEELPVLWETMIFGGPLDGYCERYTSRLDAEVGHLTAVELAKRGEPVDD